MINNNINLIADDVYPIPTAKERNYCAQGHRDDKIIRHLMTRRLHEACNTITAVIDVDDYDVFRCWDVDLIVKTNTNIIVSVEIKVDDYPEMRGPDGQMHKYIFVETVSNDKTGKVGWLYYSAANVFLYYFKKLDRFVLINANKLRDYVAANIDNLQHKTARTFAYDNRTIMYHSHGVLVDIYNLPDPPALRYFCGAKSPYKWAEDELIEAGKLEPLTPLAAAENVNGIQF